MSLGGKNPYEVRLDVMKMAQDMLSQELKFKQEQYNTRVECLKNEIDNGMLTSSSYDVHAELNTLLKTPPRGYTTADVKDKANELYSFVSDKTK